jgi:hypothetical protein
VGAARLRQERSFTDGNDDCLPVMARWPRARRPAASCMSNPSRVGIEDGGPELTLRYLWPNDIAVMLRAVLRTLVVLLAFSLTGVAGAFEAASDRNARECCTDCPAEGQGDDCPPGCPSCHCAHGSVALPRRADDRVAVIRDDKWDALPRPFEATAPRAPTLPGLYRPPRLATFEL